MDDIDLRSDTVTQPTPAMRKAMAEAELGDDVFGEDPTINRLQELAAARLGKEAGLFLPSGTMGNLAAVLTHCGRGDEVIMGHSGHTFIYEAGGISALGGVHPFTLPNQSDGTLRLEDIQDAIRTENVHFPTSRLIILENTQNRCGGVPLTAAYTCQVADLAHAHDMKLHLDGARIFNAAAALGVPVTDLTAPADSITFCLSKGLCAPVGSVLCGSKDFIARARRIRKQLGGGMRQAGVLAAAGIVALEQMTERLAEDHARARRLAGLLTQIPGLVLQAGSPASNMIFCFLSDDVKLDPQTVAQRAAEQGVKIGLNGARGFRIVVHYWVDDAAVDRTASVLQQALA